MIVTETEAETEAETVEIEIMTGTEEKEDPGEDQAPLLKMFASIAGRQDTGN
jgi:hypothetical protein